MYGKIGVNIFVIITGYYGMAEGFNLKKVLRIEFETIFVSYLLGLCSVIWICSNEVQFESVKLLKQVIKCMFPTMFGNYWYASAFIILCFIKPFLNRLILSLDKTQLRGLIVILLMVWSVIPTITLQAGSGYGWNNYLWMPIMYIIGGYIKLFGEKIEVYREKLMKIILVVSIMHVLPTIIFNTAFDGRFDRFACYLRNGNSITSVIISIALFCYAVSGRKIINKGVNYVASGVFASYLVQEHIIFRDIFWNKLMNVMAYRHSDLLIFVLAVAVLISLLLGIILHKVYTGIEKICFVKVFEKAGAWEAYLNRKVYGHYD